MNGLAFALLWFGALALHGLAVPMTPPVRGATALIALVLFRLLTRADPIPARALRARGVALLILALAWIAAPAAPLVQGPLFALAALSLGAPRAAAAALAGASLLSSMAPWLPGLDALASAEPAGPSALALPALLWALIFLLPRLRNLTRGRLAVSLALMAGGLLLSQSFAEAWHAWIGEYSGPEHAGHNHPIGLFARLPFALTTIGAGVALAWSGAPAAVTPLPQRKHTGPALAAGCAAGLLLALLICDWRAPAQPDRRLAVLNVGGLDWDRPNIEKLGAFSGGMFGLLPLYLRDTGWQVEAIGADELPGFGLARARVLVLINCHRIWSEPERARLESFVRDGGSLLVLGDHTDVFGLMKGFNSLTVPWGVEFRYDSAYHNGQGWNDDVAWLPGALGPWMEPREAGIGIGASLAVAPPARPLLTARFAFSDHGEPFNVPGSFLGNYLHDPGERTGDLVLIAAAQLGRGRVIVYGDTSGFQNGGLPFTFAAHVAPVLENLARARRFALPYALEAALALLAAAAVLAALLFGAGAGQPALLAAGAGFALGAALLFPPGASRTLARADLGRALLVDQSHLPETGHYEAGWNVPASLTTCAERAGLQVWHLDAWNGEAVRRARAIALIAPRATLSAAELADLQAACAGGATVLVAAAGGDDVGIADFLADNGVAIEASRLGAVPPEGVQKEDEPRFVDASPLLLSRPQEARELYRYGEHLLAAAVPVGTGWLVVLGDTRFFSSSNVEGTWGWWGGNLRFLHDVLGAYFGGDATNLAPLLPPPERPPDS